MKVCALLIIRDVLLHSNPLFCRSIKVHIEICNKGHRCTEIPGNHIVITGICLYPFSIFYFAMQNYVCKKNINT